MSALQEIHLIHHTHTDFGYTDLPETTFRLHREYISKAIELAERFQDYPEEARFRWTLEIMLPVENFLQHATEAEKAALFRCLDAGLLDLTAMPCHITTLAGETEMMELFRRFAPFFERYKPTVAFQNDINGFPWGLAPRLVELGVETLWMGINLYCSPPVGVVPSFRWWEGPDGSRLLVYLSTHYCEGYFWFHEEEWRRGPVPMSTSVWHHPPEVGQVWDASPENLKKAHDIFQKKQADLLKTGYPLNIVGLQVTNMWRMDNDPPYAGLPDFVRAWNEAGYEPRLRLSTCSQFMDAVKKTGVEFPAFTGDWQDWWSDGLASTPVDIALVRSAQREFKDLRDGARCLEVTFDEKAEKAFSDTATELVLATEHTWGGYASVARPYEPLSVGGNLQKRANMYQAWEDTLSLKAGIIRESPFFSVFSKTRTVAVCNPGAKIRSGWVEFDASALRQPADAVRGVLTGTVLPLEVVYGPEWAPLDESLPATYEFPEKIWYTAPLKKRFFLPEVEPGAILYFELIEAGGTVNSSREEPSVKVEFDKRAGWPAAITVEGRSLLDAGAPFGFGSIILESADCTVDVRDRLAKRDGDLSGILQYDTPKLEEYREESSHFAQRHVTVWSAPIANRIEQRWDVFRDLPRIELITTFWLKECSDILAIYLSFPFQIPGAKVSYDSLGVSTEFGTQQMPGTCGEYAFIGSGVVWRSPEQTVSMASPDLPLGTMDSLATRQKRLSFAPETQRFYSMVANNHWATNFPFLAPTKLVVRHIFDFGPGADAEAACGELWAFPAK